MRKTVVINAVGLTPRLLARHTPRLTNLRDSGRLATITPSIPAVTCTVQSTFLTGTPPSEHGIVGNGWYFRDECEVKFWRQSDKLVQQPRIWDIARRRDPDFTCANICWWYAMYCGADYTVTPRPMYPADGRKIPDVWTKPSELRDELQAHLGRFPLFKFWGPGTSIDSSRWIADAAIEVDRRFDPTLSLVYLPHLDYALQRYGPDDPRCAKDLAELDSEVGKLLDHFQSRNAAIIVLSEYGITPVSRPVHINRVLRKLNVIVTRMELGRELLDAGASQAFAVADHQVAHVYVNDPAVMPLVVRELESTPGVAHVYQGDGRQSVGLDHSRAGELIALADPDAWFTYYYWLNDARAPDFARTVDIHRKPGYDPVELFLDPKLKAPKLTIGTKLLKRRLGFWSPLDVIPLDATLVKGSHGLPVRDASDGPVFMTNQAELLDAKNVQATAVMELILRHVLP
ncbi:MAG: alkaline phosphatase family protein [Gemmatimonadaceae bacterium]|nr:alkaline phosphatase family protein [Gemmatimonadaceae bacterium]